MITTASYTHKCKELCNHVNIFFAKTSFEKLYQLNLLRSNGDRWGNLRHVRKHQSHPAAPLRWLARNFFLANQKQAIQMLLEMIFFGGKIKAQGLFSIL